MTQTVGVDSSLDRGRLVQVCQRAGVSAAQGCQPFQGALGETAPGAVSTSTPSSVTRMVCSN